VSREDVRIRPEAPDRSAGTADLSNRPWLTDQRERTRKVAGVTVAARNAGAVRWLVIWPMRQGETAGLLPVFLPGQRSRDGVNFCPDAAKEHASSARRQSPGRGHDESRRCCWSRRSRSCASPSYRARLASGHPHRRSADGRDHDRCRARHCRKIGLAQIRSSQDEAQRVDAGHT
jgi:hypothetical protein